MPPSPGKRRRSLLADKNSPSDYGNYVVAPENTVDSRVKNARIMKKII